MKHRVIALLALYLSFSGSFSAQLLYPSYSDSMLTGGILEADGVLELQGTSVRRELLSTMIFGGYIDESMKNRSFERHTVVNRLGANANGEIRYISGGRGLFGMDSVGWMVKAGAVAIGSGTYGQDVFGLLFYGNGAYLNGTADFSNTRIDGMFFQKVGVGIVNRKDRSYITLNLVNVTDYAKAYIRKGELTQNEDGSQLDLLLEGDLTTTTGNNFTKGTGASVDIDYRMKVAWGKTTTTFQLQAQNFGFAYLHDPVKTYSADSSYTYNGFSLNAFTGSNKVFGDDFSVLDSLGISQKTHNKTILLPGYLQIAKLVDPGSAKKVQSFFGIRMYPTISSIPQIYAGAYWKAAQLFHLSGGLTYGGFGNLRGGLFATLYLNKAQLMVGTEDVFSCVSHAGYGASLVTRLVWKFDK